MPARHLAQRGRRRLPGEVHGDAGRRHHRGLIRVEAVGQQPRPTTSRRSRSRRAPSAASSGTPKPSSTSRCRFHAWGPGLVDLENREPRGDLGPALGERVQACTEQDVLGDAVVGLLGDQVLDEAGPRHDRSAEPRGGDWVHVRPLAANRRPGAASRRPISSSSTCGGASTSTCIARHRAVRTAVLSGVCSRLAHLAGACSVHSRPSGSRTVICLVPQWVVLERVTTSTSRVELERVGVGHRQHDVDVESARSFGHLGDEHGTGRRRCGADRSCGRSRIRLCSPTSGRTWRPCPSCGSPGTRPRCPRCSCQSSFVDCLP